ncbi:hypothetical protein BST61_g7212 [Cercospora zeina]
MTIKPFRSDILVNGTPTRLERTPRRSASTAITNALPPNFAKVSAVSRVKRRDLHERLWLFHAFSATSTSMSPSDFSIASASSLILHHPRSTTTYFTIISPKPPALHQFLTRAFHAPFCPERNAIHHHLIAWNCIVVQLTASGLLRYMTVQHLAITSSVFMT